jgi:hypothetical protein
MVLFALPSNQVQTPPMCAARPSDARNPISDFVEQLAASLGDGTFVRLVLSNRASNLDGPERILGRCILLHGKPHLSATLRFPNRDETTNLALPETVPWVLAQLGTPFRSALLSTTTRDWQLSLPAGKRARLIRHKAAVKFAPVREHDERRASLLDASADDWLSGLGITDREGNVRPSMSDKFRQVDRYVEILYHLLKESGLEQLETAADGKELVLADMGCGKGYLTFGAWHLLHRICRRQVRVVGVELRTDLVANANRLAKEIGASGLEFVPGTIETSIFPHLGALIALHACDSATDEALGRGIEAQARLILAAPCCHKQIRPNLAHPPPLAPVLRHGLMEERLAEWVTDGLRALYLEWAGYRTKIFEFVASEHTPKNLMIAALRTEAPFSSQTARDRIRELKAFFGISVHPLDALLDKTGSMSAAS